MTDYTSNARVTDSNYRRDLPGDPRLEPKIDDAKLETGKDDPVKYKAATGEDQTLVDKVHYDLFAVERELRKHGSSVKSLLAYMAKHMLGVTLVVPDRPVVVEAATQYDNGDLRRVVRDQNGNVVPY